jgi:serine/threonine-protein kinase
MAAEPRRARLAATTPPPIATPSPPSTTALSISPLAWLQRDEIARTRKLLWVTFAQTALVVAMTPVFGGHPVTRAILIVGMIVVAGGAGYMTWVTAKPERYTPTRLAIGWMVCTAGVCTGVPYFGIFSPGPMIYILGIYFCALGHNRTVALAVYGTCVVFQGTLAALTLGGAFPDPGLIVGDRVGLQQQIAGQVLIQVIMGCTLFVGLASRKTTVEVVTELDRAVRVAAHREALLQEARADLERAMRVGAPGRFTDQTMGSFKLGVVIGRGAMAEVYEAVHTTTGAPAAVKLLRRDATSQPGVVERFLREARAVSALDAPNVVRVLELGDETAPLPYIAMERLRGEDLAQLLRAQPRLPVAEVLELVRQVARGVDAAGAARIVHRDLKPQNLFRHRVDGRAPVWKILDFGVSRLVEHAGTLTEGHLVGTPAYMAPEQAQGHAIDPRADIHALGVVAFRVLTGELPYRGADPPTIMYNVVHAPAPPPSLLGLPAACDAVFASVLAKDPADRPATAAAFADALASALGSQSTLASSAAGSASTRSAIT